MDQVQAFLTNTFGNASGEDWAFLASKIVGGGSSLFTLAILAMAALRRVRAWRQPSELCRAVLAAMDDDQPVNVSGEWVNTPTASIGAGKTKMLVGGSGDAPSLIDMPPGRVKMGKDEITDHFSRRERALIRKRAKQVHARLSAERAREQKDFYLAVLRDEQPKIDSVIAGTDGKPYRRGNSNRTL
jgi:hypothetical protein